MRVIYTILQSVRCLETTYLNEVSNQKVVVVFFLRFIDQIKKFGLQILVDS